MDFTSTSDPVAYECPQCGSARLSESSIKSAIWHGDKLVLVEGIPAIVCADCGERFYDDATALVLDLMHGNGFPEELAVGHLEVPVFFFPHPTANDPVSIAEKVA